jgi:hypothetical protein
MPRTLGLWGSPDLPDHITVWGVDPTDSAAPGLVRELPPGPPVHRCACLDPGRARGGPTGSSCGITPKVSTTDRADGTGPREDEVAVQVDLFTAEGLAGLGGTPSTLRVAAGSPCSA